MTNSIMHRAGDRGALDLDQMHGGGYEFGRIVVLMEINAGHLAEHGIMATF